ncbi:MAG: carboxypeptidase regulatory-like domain-containing protein [Desulfuromonadales bacterium]|nr:carboxypeptidase regulatory-like domain-containing protein [Desulfuromonadales bacterium]
MLRKLSIFILLLLLCGCIAASSAPSIRGKVSFERLPAAGVTVEAYRAGAAHFPAQPDFYAAATAADGLFQLSLPSGSYYLFARGAGLYSYYGRNPVLVSGAGVTDLNLGLVQLSERKIDGVADDAVYGRVTQAGLPQADVMIFVYTDLTTQLKGMGYMMAGPTDEQGRFELVLPDGIYYLLARKRQKEMTVGPLRAGDFIGYYPQNPLRVRNHRSEPVIIPMLELPEKFEQLGRGINGATSISGVIRDAGGAPVAGARVVVYEKPQLLDRPLSVSQPTGVDGRYTLSLQTGGDYYLAARNTLGGAPGPGDLYGTYDNNPDHKLQLKSGAALDGIDMIVEEMW